MVKKLNIKKVVKDGKVYKLCLKNVNTSNEYM